jgi:hypothetical protein
LNLADEPHFSGRNVASIPQLTLGRSQDKEQVSYYVLVDKNIKTGDQDARILRIFEKWSTA